MPTGDPYKWLGVPRGATADDIRKAYRRLAREHHPDANPDDPSAEERFKGIQQAYEILSNPEKRRVHDTRSRPSPRRKRAGAPRKTGGRAGRSTGSVNLSDSISRRANVSGGRTQVEYELGGEDVARIAKALGLDLTRLSKLAGEHIKMNARVSFGGGAGRESPKPPRPRKPPVPSDFER